MKRALITGTLLLSIIVAHSQPGHLNSSFGQAGVTKLNFHLPNSLSEECVKILQQADGKPLIIINAPTTSAIRGFRTAIRRLTTSGSNDATYSSLGLSQTINISAAGAALQSDGKVVVAGRYWNGSNTDFAVARYNTNGTLDNTFSSDGIQTTDFGSSDGASAVAIQSDGKIVVAGTTDVGGELDFAVARYNTNGNLDATFDGDGKKITTFSVNSDDATCLAIQPDGKILVGGSCMNINTFYSDFALVRYQTNGALDPSFDGDGRLLTNFGFDDRAFAIALQSDGKIILAGESWNDEEYNSDFAIARYNLNGSLDASFSGDGKQLTNFPGAAVWVGFRSVAIENNEKILAGGTGWDGDSENFTLVRYLPNGNVDASFGSSGLFTLDFFGGYDHINSIQLQSNGRVLLGGTSYSDDNSDYAVARLTSGGVLDQTFNFNGHLLGYFPVPQVSAFLATAAQSDGKIVAVGYSYNGADADFAIARYTTDGSLDPSFGFEGKTLIDLGNSDAATAVAIQKDGKIIVSGFTQDQYSFNSKFATVRLTNSGTRDLTFNSGLNVFTDFPSHTGYARAVAIQKDGKILVAGEAMTGSQYDNDFAIVRYKSDGTPDLTFSDDGQVTTNIGYGDLAKAMAIQSDGKIILAGSTGNFNGDNSMFTLVRYNANGSLDLTFSNDGKQTTTFGPAWSWHTINAMAIQSDGKIVVAGAASRSNNQDFAVARYLPNGSLDPFFSLDGWTTTDIQSHTGQRANALAIQCDGKILVGGFTTNNDKTSYALTRYTSNGSLDLSFNGTGMQTADGTLGNSEILGLSIVQSNVYAVGKSNVSDELAASIASYQLGTNAVTCLLPDPLSANPNQAQEENANADFKLILQATPNPATDFFSIKITGDSKEPVRMRIIDALGKIVESKTALASTSIDIGHNYAPGVYVLQGRQGHKKHTIKLVKQ